MGSATDPVSPTEYYPKLAKTETSGYQDSDASIQHRTANLHGMADGDDAANDEEETDKEDEEEEEDDEEDGDDKDEDSHEIADWGECYIQRVYFSQQEGLAQQKLNIN